MWKNYENGSTIGKSGSENGIIIQEEEYQHSCLITLEQCERHYAITCGIYGSFVHTVFCGADSYEKIYEAMKLKLQDFIDTDTTSEEESQFYEEFVSAF